ncbi:MAG: cyclic nucleotide-binding domain-containing protein [Planctomycetes bacterium]|nr:cyclic nucleotide-binding domain-containing protein [Planctomycetota bacterium]
MRAIPFIASDLAFVERVKPLVSACFEFDAPLIPIKTVTDALEYLNLEMPDLAFINFTDPAIDGFALLDAILNDSWLHYAGIIAFCDDHEVNQRLEKIQPVNLVISLVEDDAERYLPKILTIIVRNQRILFQRGIGSGLVQTLSGSFQLQNDAVEANCYANLVCNFLFNANKIDAAGKMHINIALTEMLINAIEHGNCGITYQEKSAWLEDGKLMRDLIATRCADPAVRDRRVLFEYAIAPEKSTFFFADQGPGFDWRGLKDPASAENVTVLHGRGIKMTRKYTKNLTYNEKGNEASFEIEHQADCANARPALFGNIAPVAVRTGDIVFQEGEPGDFLYYIAKGHYEVLVKNQVVSSMGADDILMGEMAFLLNNHRTATVRATTPGTLIRMSKKDFVEALKANPHYGLFLARLLAQRLQRGATDPIKTGLPRQNKLKLVAASQMIVDSVIPKNQSATEETRTKAAENGQ